MAYDPLQYPKSNVGSHQQEQIWRSPFMANTHINAHKLRFLKNIIDPIDDHRFEDDFCNKPNLNFVWYLHQARQGSGLETPDCNNEVNGVLSMTTGGDEDDSGELTQMCECWKLAHCYPLYAEIRMRIVSPSGLSGPARSPDFWFGLVEDHQWFALPTNWVAIHKDATDWDFEFGTSNGGVSTNMDNLYQPVNWNIWYRLGIHWDGVTTLRYFIIQDGNFPQTILATGTKTDNIPMAAELGLGWGIRQGAGEAISLNVDYVKCTQLRVIEEPPCAGQQ